jgi:hypothetical protein
VRARIRASEEEAADLFAEWNGEIDQISRADLRRRRSAQLIAEADAFLAELDKT